MGNGTNKVFLVVDNGTVVSYTNVGVQKISFIRTMTDMRGNKGVEGIRDCLIITRVEEVSVDTTGANKEGLVIVRDGMAVVGIEEGVRRGKILGPVTSIVKIQNYTNDGKGSDASEVENGTGT